MLASTPCEFSFLWVLSLVPRGFSLGTLERLPFVWKTRKFRWQFSGKKVTPFEVLPFSRSYQKTEIFCTICLDYQCQASCREKVKNLPVFCKWYNSIPFLLSVPEKYQYHMTEIFHRNFRTNGKRPWCTPLLKNRTSKFWNRQGCI